MNKHTQLPWYTKDGNSAIFSTDADYGNSIVIAAPHLKSDAKFITRSANSHYQLLHCVKNSLEHFEELSKISPKKAVTKAAIKALKEAIKLAEAL